MSEIESEAANFMSPATSPSSLNGALPRAHFSLKLYEYEGKVMLDIADDAGGLGLLIDFDPLAAYRLGYRLMERARFLGAKPEGDAQRQAIECLSNEIK